MTTSATQGPLPGASLNAARRARELEEATDGRVVDLVVIGLGVTGAGVALDAASRGLSVVAIDAHDLAFGTSRWSSKMVHGGVRYLAKGQVGVAFESAVERGVLLTTTAPHLVRALPMVMPLTPRVSHRKASAVGAAFVAADVLRATARTARAELPGPRRLSPTEALHLVPGLRPDGLRGALLSWDGRLEDDARLVVAIARTAASYGARVLTRCRALEVSGDGAHIRDELTGTTSTIKARAVVNAAGVWAGQLVPGVRLRPSLGSHIILKSAKLGSFRAQVTTPVPGESNRYAFAIPQPDGLVYVGLTDEPVDGPMPDVPVPPERDIAFLLDIIAGVFERPLQRSDVVGAFAGLRPLLGADGHTADLSRRHAVLTSPGGVVTVVGGKLTTYRRMAEDAVDAAVAQRELQAGACRTRRLPLVGAADRSTLARLDAPARLVRRYGIEAVVLARDPALLAPVSAEVPVTLAELVWGVQHEGALDVDDLLDRRTRVGLVGEHRAATMAAAEQALSLLGSHGSRP